jgi:hypothetical protein
MVANDRDIAATLPISGGSVPASIRQAEWLRIYLSKGRPLNPTADLWRYLLQSGFPFIKKELLRDNPTRVADISEWRAVASERAIDLASMDLERCEIASERGTALSTASNHRAIMRSV